MSNRLMQILASLAQRRALRTLDTICETQHQISTRKLGQYLEPIGDELAGHAFHLRMEYDALTSKIAALEAENARLRAGQEPVAFYWQDVGYKNPNRHGPYFGLPTEAALRNVDGWAIPIPLYTTPQPSAVPEVTKELAALAWHRAYAEGDDSGVDMSLRVARHVAALLAPPPATVQGVNQQLLEALTDSLELMETLCAFEGDTIRKARAAIAAARQEGKVAPVVERPAPLSPEQLEAIQRNAAKQRPVGRRITIERERGDVVYRSQCPYVGITRLIKGAR